MTLEETQKRFESVREKKHWNKLTSLLLSEDKESVVMGANLLCSLNEEVYYDGICTFLHDDGKGNWVLNAELDCTNKQALQLEIVRMAENNIGHILQEAFERGRLDELLLLGCEEVECEVLSAHHKERLLSKVTTMVEVQGEKNRFLVMKYPVTQVLWEHVKGSNPSWFRGASRPVERIRWMDCVVFANTMSERHGLEKVYDFLEGTEEACARQKESIDTLLDKYADYVKVNEEANGYRLPTSAEWEYTAKGGEEYTYAGGNDLDEVGWYHGNSGKMSRGVGQKKSNPYGVSDMSGNVWEWCFDTDQDDPSYRVYRGGASHLKEYYCVISRCGRGSPSTCNSSVGVRLFRSIVSEF